MFSVGLIFMLIFKRYFSHGKKSCTVWCNPQVKVCAVLKRDELTCARGENWCNYKITWRKHSHFVMINPPSQMMGFMLTSLLVSFQARYVFIERW